MTRSCYKLPFTAKSIFRKSLQKHRPGAVSYGDEGPFPQKTETTKAPTPLYQRGSTIVPEMLGSTVKIHSGHKFVKLIITEHVIGYKFGEFAPTKKRALYKKKKTTNKAKKGALNKS